MEHCLGIVIPTFSRHRFLPRVFDQVRQQTHPHWRCVVVSDGPDPQARRLFDRHTDGDGRFSYAELPLRANDWGLTPRCEGVQRLAALPEPPDYVLFWDDDDAYFPHALAAVSGALSRHPGVDLLLAPVHARLTCVPNPGMDPYTAEHHGVLTANFVVRLPVAATHLPGDPQRGERGTDCRFFDRVRAGRRHSIALADIPPIGRCDGLRWLVNLRWRLGIPPLGLASLPGYEPLRFLLRR